MMHMDDSKCSLFSKLVAGVHFRPAEFGDMKRRRRIKQVDPSKTKDSRQWGNMQDKI